MATYPYSPMQYLTAAMAIAPRSKLTMAWCHIFYFPRDNATLRAQRQAGCFAGLDF
jgi:hypothetical protein